MLKNIKLDAQLLVKDFVTLQNFIKLYLVKLCLNFSGSPQVCTCINLDENLDSLYFMEGKKWTYRQLLVLTPLLHQDIFKQISYDLNIVQ